ncbi:MAG: phosphonopyruvate decarboxylase [Dysgonamonadaceae bacterium]|jgi:phosphonopyruvate decarboxylase|nr:phosphonopyruvate decarboxylase [Dysgonamonadaceae bacterium]
MINTKVLYDLLINNGFDLFTGVPDSLLKDICSYISDNTPSERHIIAANEGAAVAVAAGYYLATRKLSLVYMQNSGIGNAVNPLLSLADEKAYQIPMLLMVGWRGEPGTKDEPQHVKQGEVTLALFDAMKIPYIIIDSNENTAKEQFLQLITDVKTKETSCAAIIRKNTFSPYKLKNSPKNDWEMSREDALQTVIDSLTPQDVVISTTGKMSRELFEYREYKNEGHDKDFLTVGSMGHSSSIALGVALSAPDRQVYCLDGDGAMLMHMGSMATAGTSGAENFRHIVFNNGVHESVGAQPTVAFKISLPEIANACGYRTAQTATDIVELKEILKDFRARKGPAFLEIKVNTITRENLGRPTRTTHENRNDFMRNLNKNNMNEY